MLGFAIFLNACVFAHIERGKRMLAIERKNQILTILQDEKKVVVAELSVKFGVSEETIRRDLEKLEKEGYVVKAYGGAVLNENAQKDLPSLVRRKTNIVGKQRIAELISAHIKDGDSVMLDASSTALYIAQKIKDKKNITLITNSVEILYELSDMAGWKIFSTGGIMAEGAMALIGPYADSMVGRLHVSKAIVSCKGLEKRRGITDSSEVHSSTKRAMLGSADQKILAVDHLKFDRSAFDRVCGFEEIDILVTDRKPSPEWMKLLEKHGIECHYPEEEQNG